MKKRNFLILMPVLIFFNLSLAFAAPMSQTSTFVILEPPPSILPNGNVGAIYGIGLTANGGSGPVTWSIISGKLPDGLTIFRYRGNSSTMIHGTPTRVQTTTFTVEARDRAGNRASRTYTLTIDPPLPLYVAHPSSTLPDGTVGVYYATNLFANGGVQPYSWAIVAGQLPPGLRLSGNQINGTPTTAGNFAFTARVTDSTGVQASKDFTILIR